MKLREMWWDFIFQLSTSQKMFQNQHGCFSAVKLFLGWLCKMPSGWDWCWSVFSFSFFKGAGVKPSPGLVCQGRWAASMPRMQSPRCSSSLQQDEQQLFIIHLGQAGEIMKWGLKSTFLQFHVFIYGLRNVVWGCIFHGGAGFLTTLQEFIFTAATHPISLQDFQEQRAGPNHLFCVDLTQNGANQRKERSPNFYSSIQVPLKLLLGSPPTSCWDLSRREEGREEKQEEDAMSLRTS